MKIVKESEIINLVSFHHEFKLVESPGCGYSFDCDKSGNVLPMNPVAQKNYELCLAGYTENGKAVLDHGINKREYSHRVCAVGECSCGSLVSLSSFTNTCDKCHADYNSFGQRLAPRSQWGEETGESVSDILNSNNENVFDDY